MERITTVKTITISQYMACDKKVFDDYENCLSYEVLNYIVAYDETQNKIDVSKCSDGCEFIDLAFYLKVPKEVINSFNSCCDMLGLAYTNFSEKNLVGNEYYLLWDSDKNMFIHFMDKVKAMEEEKNKIIGIFTHM